MFYWHKRLLVKYLLHAICFMLCSLKHIILVWLHKGEPNIQPLTHYIMALKMHVLLHCILYNHEDFKGDSCWTGQPVQGIGPSRCSFTHTNCTSHLNQGCSLWWETPGYKSWPRNPSWGLCQWLTSVHYEQHRALGQISTFYLHFSLCLHFLFSSWLCPAFTARSSQQWFPLARDSEEHNRVVLSAGAPRIYCNNNNYWWKPLSYFPKLQVRYPVPCSHSRVSNYSPHWKMLYTFKENYSSVFLLKMLGKS